MLQPLLVVLPALVRVAAAGSLNDIEHVVLFMQENRAFDHYFGTMAGVRNFADPNVQVNPDGLTTFQQPTYQTNVGATTLNPWYIAYQGGSWSEAAQCTASGSNEWQENHRALNDGLNNRWVPNCTAYSWSHFQRQDIPTHFSIAEGWTVADMYQESLITATNPNRMMWMTGSVNVPGGPQSPDQGGVMLDNNETPGCEGPHLNCYPLNWTTYPEYLQNAGVSWQVYQDEDNFDDNRLTAFTQYQNAPANSPLTIRGNSFVGLDKFYSDAEAGTLPQVSWIIGPAELSEHPPYLPKDGAWLQQQVVNAVTKGKSYNNTVLIISYDETGGWGDHVTPFHSPNGTAGEWMEDPYGNEGYTYSGPGFRLPFYIVSPWTRGGRVFTEHADHISQILFVEKWLEAKGFSGVQTTQISDWRRTHMSDLTNAFDFNSPDTSLPSVVNAPTPSKDKNGNYDGSAVCVATYGTPEPKVPYGTANENSNPAALTEQGFKPVRGYLTEGRYLTFEMNGYALTSSNSSSRSLTTSKATTKHDPIAQRWILHAISGTATDGGQGSGTFYITSAAGSSYLTSNSTLTQSKSSAGEYTIADLGNGAGYSIQCGNSYLGISNGGWLTHSGGYGNNSTIGFQIYSVTYHS